MSSNLILGESADEICEALLGMDLQLRPRGTARLNGKVDATGPLVRALLRAEAELLVADALAMKVGTYEERTPAQRRADALMLVTHRTAEVTRAA
jgi:hypothetical protein